MKTNNPTEEINEIRTSGFFVPGGIDSYWIESHKLTIAVLNDTNERAKDLLTSADAPIIPGTIFASLPSIAEYFGVEIDYIRGVLLRRGLSRNTMPSDMLLSSLSRLLRETGSFDAVEMSRDPFDNNRTRIIERKSSRFHSYEPRISVPHDSAERMLFCSARVFLALAAIMIIGRSTANTRSNINKIYAMIQKSSYSADFERRLEGEKSIMEAEKKRVEAEAQRAEETLMRAKILEMEKLIEPVPPVEMFTASLAVEFSPELLQALVKAAVEAAVISAMKQLGVNAPQEAKYEARA